MKTCLFAVSAKYAALIKSGAAPAEIGGMEKKLIVNIDADLSDMVD